jgi:hypothetical protein
MRKAALWAGMAVGGLILVAVMWLSATPALLGAG